MVAENLRDRFRKRAGMRLRATLGAVLVVGVALAIAGVSMVVLLRRSLTDNVRATAQVRAQAVADLVEADALERLQGGSDDEFVQVLDTAGGVVAASPNLKGGGPAVVLPPGGSARVEVPFEDDPFMVVAAPASTEAGNHTVLVGRTLDGVVESTAAVTSLLAVGLPFLLLVIASVTWRVIGRALSPVEAIRTEVDAISTSELHRRVPVPATDDEIARLAATMNRMLERLDQGHERQRRFISDASHEFRSPVASIRQHAEVALRHPAQTSQEELARNVLDEDLRLQRLVEDLLLLARMSEHDGEGVARVVDLDDVVFEEVERMRHLSDKSLDATGVSGGRIHGDRKQLARLVGNLVENALRHADGRVAVALRSDGPDLVLLVDDDGRGVPADQSGRIFERFVRLEEARDRDSGGAGLGLAIVAEVAGSHGGSARVGDSPLGGARFEIRFPSLTDDPSAPFSEGSGAASKDGAKESTSE